MKNRIRLRKLNRTSSHRAAMFRNMVTSLIEHERIRTTLPKAKEMKRIADRAVTWAKKGVQPPNRATGSIDALLVFNGKGDRRQHTCIEAYRLGCSTDARRSACRGTAT